MITCRVLHCMASVAKLKSSGFFLPTLGVVNWYAESYDFLNLFLYKYIPYPGEMVANFRLTQKCYVALTLQEIIQDKQTSFAEW